jgi:hypothetical protein
MDAVFLGDRTAAQVIWVKIVSRKNEKMGK